jgi:hypothetical protein
MAQQPNKPDTGTQQKNPTTEQSQPDELRTPPAAKETNSPQITNAPEVPKDQQTKTAIYKSSCGDTTEHSQADLCEQQRMSTAAERAANYAWWQLIVGAIGLGAVALSLIFAGIGAFAARDAAIAGTQAARIARNAERPYIVPIDPIIRELSTINTGKAFDPIYVRQFPAVFSVHFGLQNIGRGLGIILEYGITHELCAMGKHGENELITRNGFGGFVLSPGSQWTSEVGFHQFQITEDESMDYDY